MKFKFIAVFSIIILCFVNSLAQERNLEIEISMEENVIEKNAKNIPVKVTITNKAGEVLKTEGLRYVRFYFAKCFIIEGCFGVHSIYGSSFVIPPKKLKEFESMEFEVNLVNLAWHLTRSSNDISYKKNFHKVVPIDNIYLKSSINILKGYKMNKDLKQKMPVYKIFRSNTITIVRE